LFPALLLFVALALPAANTPSVEIRDSEVWLVRDGHALQLTDDGKSKLQAELSPAQDRIAYYEQCPENEHCTPSLVILTLDGDRLESFHVPPEGTPCTGILAIAWTGPKAVSVECHINPSLDEYFEIGLSTKQVFRDLLGYDFTRSPDGKTIAHVGWIPHFAPPYAQSNYLQLDDVTIYPLPESGTPKKQEGLDEQPYVVLNKGLHYYGIHEFVPGLAWSPDSRRVALVDCIYNWTANSANSTSGEESNRQCSVAVVSPDGSFQLFPLPDPSLHDLYESHLEWSQPAELLLHIGDTTKRIPVLSEN
jgi:hypothetical protein